MMLFVMLIALISPGDMFVVRYPVSDSLRGSVYAPLDTFYIEDSSTLFSVNLGYIHISALSSKAIDSTIRKVYERILPGTNINIQRYIKVSVIGEVRTPHVIYVKEKEPVSTLIALAGGPTEFANLKKIKIFSQGKHTKLNYYKAVEERITLDQLGVSSGDVIEVPKKFRINFTNISAAISSIVLLWSFYQANFQNN